MANLLHMEGITKSFPGVLALNNVSLSVEKGEVHALLGENGAGKSTLMKVLSGAYKKDAGEITFDGEPIAVSSPKQAQGLGISIIYQELNLVPQMTVTENIFLCDHLMRNPVKVDWKRMHEEAHKILQSLDCDINPYALVKDLGIAQRQMVEVAKSLSQKAKIIIMDEPTSPLTDRETQKLFQTIRKLKNEGVSVIYISHRLEEVKDIADRATIMRDGNTICTVNVKDVSMRDIIRHMVGHELTEQFPKIDAKIGEVLFEAKGITRKGVLDNISFRVRAGEVLGICGLVGAGRTEAMRAIFGVDAKTSGSVYIGGKEAHIHRPLDAISAGIGFVTEDRKDEGLVLCRDCKENISLVALRNYSKLIHVNLTKERAECQNYVEKLNIKTPSLYQKVFALSGGNQQKVVLAKWLMSDARVLILDEPTRGIDVGAKVEVYNIINEIIKSGKAIIMVSSEMTELMGMCDRIVVMCRGRVIGELGRDEFSQSSLMYLAAGGDQFIKEQ